MSRIAPFVLSAVVSGCSASEPAVTIERGGGEEGVVLPGEEAPAVDVGQSAQRVAYPPPPYGTAVGTVIENLRFLGWNDPLAAGFDTSSFEEVSLAGFYDPDGVGSTRFVVVTSTAVWCGVCRGEYEDFRDGRVAEYSRRGVAFLGALFEDNDSNPARPEDLELWAELYDVGFPFGLDPAFKLGRYFDREATPMTLVVDTRTMEITWLEVGWAREGQGSLWAHLDDALAR